MEYWKPAHHSKAYEALTAIADKRIELTGESTAVCTSSSRGKAYELTYDPETNSMMSNDNTAFWTGSISYPMVAFLMLKGKIAYHSNLLEIFKDIRWKDIIQQNKKSYDKAVEVVLTDLAARGTDMDFVRKEMAKIHSEIAELKLGILGSKRYPPQAY